MSVWAVIVAGGSGTRMGMPVNKALAPLAGKTVLERSLEELQCGTVKVQFVPADDWTLPPDLKVLHLSAVGRIQTAIIRGNADVVGAVFAAANPIFYDIVPLTLEEVFIYEMGGENYAVKDLVI